MTTGSVHETAGLVPGGNCGGPGQYLMDFSRSWSGGDRVSKTDKSPHPYTCSIVSQGCGAVKLFGGTVNQPLVNCYGGVILASAPWDSNDELTLLSKLVDQIRGHDFNAGVFAGTFGQTVSLIGDRTARLARGIVALKKGHGPDQIIAAISGRKKIGAKFSASRTERARPVPRKRKDTSPWNNVEHEYRVPVEPFAGLPKKSGYVKKDIYSNSELSSTWLEASYGWLPLVSDIHEASRALANYMEAKRKVTFRVQRTRRNILNSSDYGVVSNSHAERSSRIIYTFASEMDYPSQLDLLGLKNPASVVWELMPWSFAIDWVLPVGSFLDSLSLVPFLKGTWVRTDVERQYGTMSVNWQDTTTETPSFYRALHINRTVGSGGFNVPLPSFKSPISSSWMRTANQIALSIGLLKRHLG